MMDHYLFIDGRYLDLAHTDLIQRFYGVHGELDIATVISSFSAQRTYYYNALDDDLRASESEADFKARLDSLLARFDAINALPATHVQLGTVTGKSVKKRRQKQVDVQLAVDALLHTFNRNVGRVTLIAGDLDFKPLVDALVSLGVNTRIFYEKRSAAPHLYGAADHADEITLKLAWDWCTPQFQSANPIPREALNENMPVGQHLKIGIWKGRETRLIKAKPPSSDPSYSIFALGRGKDMPLRVESRDRALLEKYFEFVHGAPEWHDVIEE